MVKAMLSDEEIEQLNRGYVCPPDAGPAWREAARLGFDMSLLEEMKKKTPEERLAWHQKTLNSLLALREEQSDGSRA
ncbi:MAG TPA: hypothetical protein VEH27_13885 [Methylomirabilota bacterium]|nr:hypothetical protein [Methylomirabilota bacterium]